MRGLDLRVTSSPVPEPTFAERARTLVYLGRVGSLLHLEAEYIYADCLFASSTLLQSGGGPYIFVN